MVSISLLVNTCVSRGRSDFIAAALSASSAVRFSAVDTTNIAISRSDFGVCVLFAKEPKMTSEKNALSAISCLMMFRLAVTVFGSRALVQSWKYASVAVLSKFGL